MSGPENLRGVDYQVSVALLRLIHLLDGEVSQVSSVKFDSLTDDEEDLTIFYADGRTQQVQVKKKSEGYQWTPSELRDILAGFHRKNSPTTHFRFVSDRGGNPDVVKLKRLLAEEAASPSDEFLTPFTSEKLPLQNLKEMLPRLELATQYFPAANDVDPAAALRREIAAAILTPPFAIDLEAETVVTLLWKVVYDWSRASVTINTAELANGFAACGLHLSRASWLQFPSPPTAPTRRGEFAALNSATEQHGVVVLVGISGTGKTSLLSLVASESAKVGRTVAWFGVTSLSVVDDLTKEMADFVAVNGDPDFHRSLDATRSLSDRATKLGTAMSRISALLLIDGFDKGPAVVRDFIGSVLSSFVDAGPGPARVVLSTTFRPNFCSQEKVLSGLITLHPLEGFTYEDAQTFLRHSGIHLTGSESKEIWALLGGHPLSFVLLKNLAEQGHEGGMWTSEIKQRTVEGARAWLFERVFINLPEVARQTLLAVSIFEYPFSEAEAYAVLPGMETRTGVQLYELIRRGLVSVRDKSFVVHDAVRGMAYDILADASKALHHEQAALWYQDVMQQERQAEDGILYETILKWGKHVERASGRAVQTPGISLLMARSPAELDVLWAIQRFGHPFSFAAAEPDGADKAVTLLTQLGVVEAGMWISSPHGSDAEEEAAVGSEVPELDEDSDENESGEGDRFRINLRGEFDGEFIDYLCLARGISGHMGYIPVFVPNENWMQQGLICQWEHCIELQKFPPRSRRQCEEHIQFLKDEFAKHGYAFKAPEVREFLLQEIEEGVPADAVDEPDPELLMAGCPVFGHMCPGGPAQASECRTEMDEDETDDKTDEPQGDCE